MDNRSFLAGGLSIAGLFLLLVIAGCGPVQAPGPTAAPPSLPTTTPQPTLSLADTSAREFFVADFASVHQADRSDPNKFLIFGGIPITPAPDGLPPEVAVYLGRWEGYGNFAPVRNDRKVVLAIQQISAVGGRLYAYSGTSLQFPDTLIAADFRVVPGDPPALEFQAASHGIYTLTYDKASQKLAAWASNGSRTGPYELTRERNFYVYQDYPAYLASRRIYAREYQDPELRQYGAGYLVYLPENYEIASQKAWPLIYFLHGMGDVGENIPLLAKASPFMFIREHGPLPAVIVAPLANNSPRDARFPVAYMDGVLKEVQAAYRVDPRRIYLTGLSMGGEAAWRFALYRPDTFAAIAPLSTYLPGALSTVMSPIRSLPVWAIHGAEDTVVPLVMGQQPVEALKAAGGEVKFTVLQGQDHDTWTSTYSDPAFYDWLFQHQKQ